MENSADSPKSWSCPGFVGPGVSGLPVLPQLPLQIITARASSRFSETGTSLGDSFDARSLSGTTATLCVTWSQPQPWLPLQVPLMGAMQGAGGSRGSVNLAPLNSPGT